MPRRALTGVLFLVTMGCGPSTQMAQGTQRAVGADAAITVQQIEGGNQLVTVDVRHLPPPERVAPGTGRYVVWFARPGHLSTMASQLHYDPGARTGRARATIPHRGFEVIVTAERPGPVSEPSEHVVVRHRPR